MAEASTLVRPSSTRRPSVAVLVVFGVIAAFRLTLLGRGAMAFLDETMYYKAALALDQLRGGHLAAAINHIASNNGRPGNAILQLVPAALQAIPFAFGVSPSNPWSLMIPVACNALVTLATLFFFWRIALQLFDGDRVASALAAAVYGVLANSNLYVRHLLANEPAMCIVMAALWLALSRPATLRLAVSVGLLSGFAVTVYPGYAIFALVPAVSLTVSPGLRVAARALAAAGFAAGVTAIVLAMELFCRAGGISYVASARTLSGTITQGSFDEGWIFLPRYLIQVERFAGAVLLCGAAAFAYRLLRVVAGRRTLRPIHWVVIAATAGWAWQAFASTVLHSMVLYGRLIHPWMAFLVWATIESVRSAPRAALRNSLYAIVALASVVSWFLFARDYLPVAYPADVLYAFRINTAIVPAAQRRCLMSPLQVYESPAPLDRRTGAPYSARRDYTLINFCQGEPSAEHRPAADATCSPERFRAPHFMAFRAYGFEGLTPEQRDEIARPEYALRICAP
jgi:hypothetical protein